MDILQIAGALLLSLAVLFLLRELHRTLAHAFSLCAAFYFFSLALDLLSPSFSWFHTLASSDTVGAGVGVLLASLGIGLVTGFLSEFLRDVGEGALSRAAELCGKGAILALALPLFQDFFEMLRSVLQ